MLNKLTLKLGGKIILETLSIIAQVITQLGLITCILLSTSKSEGLSGTLGGHKDTVFRGRKGSEDILERTTTFFAVSFLVVHFLIFMFF